MRNNLGNGAKLLNEINEIKCESTNYLNKCVLTFAYIFLWREYKLCLSLVSSFDLIIFFNLNVNVVINHMM